jgi:transposase
VPFALPDALFFTGIDWAAETHAVCVLDAGGKIVARFTIEHSADGIAALIRRLARYGEPGDMPVAIERPDGRLVDLLLEAGHPVVPVKPNAIKTWRDGEVLSGAKSDAGDAAVIAEYLRLRAHKLRAVAPYSDETRALRTVVRTRDDMVAMRVAAASQLAALLEAHWPGAKAIFADIESPISLEFLTRYPTRPLPRTWARSGWPRSAPSTATLAAAPPRSCSPGCAPRRRALAAKPSPRGCVTPCSPRSAC